MQGSAYVDDARAERYGNGEIQILNFFAPWGTGSCLSARRCPHAGGAVVDFEPAASVVFCRGCVDSSGRLRGDDVWPACCWRRPAPGFKAL